METRRPRVSMAIYGKKKPNKKAKIVIMAIRGNKKAKMVAMSIYGNKKAKMVLNCTHVCVNGAEVVAATELHPLKSLSVSVPVSGY